MGDYTILYDAGTAGHEKLWSSLQCLVEAAADKIDQLTQDPTITFACDRFVVEYSVVVLDGLVASPDKSADLPYDGDDDL